MFVRKFYRTKIGRAMGMVFLLLLIPMVGLNLLLSAQSATSIQDGLVQNYENTLQLSAEQFADRLQDLCQLTYSLTLDSELNTMSIAEAGTENLLEYVRFHTRLLSYTTQRLLYSNITVLLPKQRWTISTGNYINPLRDLPEFDESLTNLKESLQWGIRPQRADPEENCLSIVTGYVSPTQSNALFFIELPRESVLDAIAPLSDSAGIEATFLMDQNGEVYISPKTDIDAAQFIAETGAQRSDFFSNTGKSGVHEFDYRQGNARYTVLAREMPGTHCALGVVLDTEQILWPRMMIGGWTVAGLAVFCAIAAIYMYISYRHVVAPIDDIHETMKLVGQGDFTAGTKISANNEIGDIAVSLNQMVEQLRELIGERYVHEIQLAQTQLKFLRAQINPHFLYNSLFTLYTFIKNEDLDSASDLAIYLGQYYQINTRVENGDIALYQELEHVRLLVKIQNMRFGDRLQYEEDVEESLKLMPVPNLTILTIAENFLTHGIKNIRGAASLKISAVREEGWIVLTVADTGEGMTQERLEEIRARLENVDLEESNLRGLQNVLVRFRMAYGDQVEFSVYPNEPRGLVNRIRIPDKGGKPNV